MRHGTGDTAQGVNRRQGLTLGALVTTGWKNDEIRALGGGTISSDRDPVNPEDYGTLSMA